MSRNSRRADETGDKPEDVAVQIAFKEKKKKEKGRRILRSSGGVCAFEKIRVIRGGDLEMENIHRVYSGRASRVRRRRRR